MAPGLSELASTILHHTQEIEKHLEAQGLPPPSFDVHAPIDVALPENLTRSRQIVLETIENLHAQIAGPLPQLMRLLSPAINVWTSLEAINRFRIAEKLALDERISFSELARRCGLSESDVRRLLRLAIANRIFEEPEKGIVAHNALSRLLAESAPVRHWTEVVLYDMWPSSTRVVDAMVKWPGSEEPSHTGFALANGTADAPANGFFDTIKSSPERSRRFADAMKLLQSAPPFALSHLLTNLPWDVESPPALLVDVGGSYGSVAIEMLRKHQHMRCIVQDLEEVVSRAKIPLDLEGRLTFQKQDFFEEQMVRGADVYFFRSILHDWSDTYAARILKNLIPALKHGAKILLNEICLPEPGVLPLYQDQVLRGYDLAMKQNFNGKERDADDWAELLGVADPRFKLIQILSPPESTLSIIEVAWDGPTSF